MAAPPVGLDITSNALLAVALKRKGKSYSLARHAMDPLPLGIVDGGEVVDTDRLAQAIHALWDREKIKERSVALGVANQRCLLRMIPMPRLKKRSELKEAIALRVGEELPIPLEDAVWDFHTVGTFKDEQTGAEWQRHVVVMTYRESVERFRDAVVAAGLKLARIDLSGFALMRSGMSSVRLALEANDESVDDAVVALCDIGRASTNLVVSRGGTCELNRIVAFGTSHFSATLAEQFGWTESDAERVAFEAGVLPVGGMEAAGDPYVETRRVTQYVADQFAQELRTSFDYYHHASDAAYRVGRVVLAGEGALLPGIETRFAAELGVPVSVVDVSPRVDPKTIETLGAQQPRFATALGLAMEDAA